MFWGKYVVFRCFMFWLKSYLVSWLFYDNCWVEVGSFNSDG